MTPPVTELRLRCTGPEALLHTLAKAGLDPKALRVVALLLAELDVMCRERIVITEKEHHHVRA